MWSAAAASRWRMWTCSRSTRPLHHRYTSMQCCCSRLVQQQHLFPASCHHEPGKVVVGSTIGHCCNVVLAVAQGRQQSAAVRPCDSTHSGMWLCMTVTSDCLPGHILLRRAGPGPGQGEPQRRRHRDGPPAGRHRCAALHSPLQTCATAPCRGFQC